MSKAVWAVGEVDGGGLVSSTPGIATLARDLGGDEAVGLIVAADNSQAAADLARYLPHVVLARTPEGTYVTPSALAPYIARLVRERQPSYLLIPGTPFGRELAGALSAHLQWGVLANAIDISWEKGFETRSVVFRSDVRVRSEFTADHGIVTVQPHAATQSAMDAQGTIETIDVPAAELGSQVQRTELVTEAAQSSVEGARVVVAGGAGVGTKEAWALVESLAAALDGAVGASRPAVDKGWAPYSQQIGQTGKTVRPDLYIALGISGEVQHRVGMRMAKTVVAIDTSLEAPFAEHADLFVNADLNEIVPPLTENVIAARGKGGST